MHPSTQHVHTKTGPIAVPWCRVLIQAWHIPLPLQGWHYAFIQTKVDKALSCYMALPRSNKLNILIKYSLLWSGVKFFNSMWLKNIERSKSCCNWINNEGTKSLPEPMLTDHQWSPVTFLLGQLHKRCLNHQSLKSIWKHQRSWRAHCLKLHQSHRLL